MNAFIDRVTIKHIFTLVQECLELSLMKKNEAWSSVAAELALAIIRYYKPYLGTEALGVKKYDEDVLCCLRYSIVVMQRLNELHGLRLGYFGVW